MTKKPRSKSRRHSCIQALRGFVGKTAFLDGLCVQSSHIPRTSRPLITVLEDRGVTIDSFLALQSKATAKVITASDTMEKAIEHVRVHSLGTVYGLPWILAYIAKAGIRAAGEEGATKLPLDCDLINAALKFSKSHVLREIKHDARIRIEDAYQLVGVVDEGPAYVAAGYENVYCLKPGEIYGTCPY